MNRSSWFYWWNSYSQIKRVERHNGVIQIVLSDSPVALITDNLLLELSQVTRGNPAGILGLLVVAAVTAVVSCLASMWKLTGQVIKYTRGLVTVIAAAAAVTEAVINIAAALLSRVSILPTCIGTSLR